VTLAATEAELRRVLRGAVFTMHYGLRLVSLGDGRCVLEMPFSRAIMRPGGIVSGPALMAAADATMWIAVLTRLGPRDGSVTSTMTTTFLRAGQREPVRCEARVLRLGRRLVYGVAQCTGRDGALLSHHVMTYARPEVSGPENSRVGMGGSRGRAGDVHPAVDQSRIQDSARGMSGRARARSAAPAEGASRRRSSTSARR
jgi:uncharacterized protein (TIGR00369 family)